MPHERTYERFGLKYNPFPPATTGIAGVRELWLPPSWEKELRKRFDRLTVGGGDKAMALIGPYGAGKTYVLSWIQTHLLAPEGIQPFSFDNPGVRFYDLADSLLRQVGRYELSKALWEVVRPHVEQVGLQPLLIPPKFPDWLDYVKRPPRREKALVQLSQAIVAEGLTKDEEIAHRVAQIVIGTGDRPYYEYRDFIAGRAGTLVAEREEPNYFRTLIRILSRIYGDGGIAFLVDEFEDVATAKRLNTKQSYEYMATLRRLLDVSGEEDFWLVVSMTPEALVQTKEIQKALMERFVDPFEIPLLSPEEARQMIEHRIADARLDGDQHDGLWPFADDAVAGLSPTIYSLPRPLVKVFWAALAEAERQQIELPIPSTLLKEAEESQYPAEEVS